MIKFLKTHLNLIGHRVFLVPLIMIIQIAIIFLMTFEFYSYFIVFYIICSIFSLLMVLHIVNSRANPGYKIAWIIPVMAFPIFGLLLYVLFSGNQLSKRQKDKMRNIYYKQFKYKDNHNIVMNELRYDNMSAYNQVKYISNYSLTNVCKHTKTTYLSSGKTYYNKLLEAIKNAQKYIFLEYFIIGEGKMWNTILDILKQKVQEGVEVRVIYDDFGCIMTLPNHYDKILEKEGIKTAVFNRFVPNLKSKFNNRDHRKIAIIDGHIAFTGGINLADEYINEKVRFGHWKDTAIMLEGKAVKTFTQLFLQMWNITEKEVDFSKYLEVESKVPAKTSGYVIPYADFPLEEEKVAENVYMDILNRAHNYVHIMTPYLILDGKMERALTFAAERGVDVELILPGIPDKPIPYALAKTHFKQLLQAGVKIYLYTPGFVHAKVFVADDKKAVVGTINLDYRSLYHHFECAAFMYKTDCIPAIAADFEETKAKSTPVTLASLQQEPVTTKVVGALTKTIAPLL